MKELIMVIDDDMGVQECLQAILEAEGYEVMIARDGKHALEMLATARPNLIILDLMMPRMNGYEFLKTLEQQGRRAELPIILLTADPQVKERATKLAVNAYLLKPFELLDLLDSVANVLA
ncbi:hypothetical protein KDA_18330 [Dictyobacter alpinus]|uniref:Response regulatory domain-containing protein n=1 Tax=Dictyobacter alpinus TaxID=2014873 RepID=A0A402B4R8_9CHLR|nr:response regulator [Dictyobacter alpinus]GCE26349.1 hypothetical protein KDA_18330 [Dictyobacter alpinus]